jgi:putative sigma-54 modulation protein
MQLNITFRHLEPTEALKSHVRGRVEHVQRFIDRPTEAHAVLHVENLAHHAEITDMYASIDAAADKIERQLKKHKGRLTDQHKVVQPPTDWAPVDVRHDVLDVMDHPERPSHRVVKSTSFEAKPMSLDEAIMQLDLLETSFYVFQNTRDRTINIVYRRDDGNCGLIEARTA